VTNFSGRGELRCSQSNWVQRPAQDGTGASEVASTLCLSALAQILRRLVNALLVIQTLLRNVTRSVTLYFRRSMHLYSTEHESRDTSVAARTPHESTNFEHAWLRLMRMGRTGLSAPAILRPLALSSPERH
jgi:hypothetical protein